MTVVPGATAVTVPFSSTVATSGLLLVQVSWAVAPSGEKVGTSAMLVPASAKSSAVLSRVRPSAAFGSPPPRMPSWKAGTTLRTTINAAAATITRDRRISATLGPPFFFVFFSGFRAAARSRGGPLPGRTNRREQLLLGGSFLLRLQRFPGWESPGWAVRQKPTQAPAPPAPGRRPARSPERESPPWEWSAPPPPGSPARAPPRQDSPRGHWPGQHPLRAPPPGEPEPRPEWKLPAQAAAAFSAVPGPAWAQGCPPANPESH